MKQFNFRLQKVLEYRIMVEQWAKEAYLDARTTRLEAEMKQILISEQRHHALTTHPASLDEHRSLEARLQKLDDKEIQQQVIINVLKNEEEKALAAWTEKRVELESLNKLHTKQKSEWLLDMDRKMQAELDEWSLRKKAA